MRTKGHSIRIGVPDSLNFALWIRRQSWVNTPADKVVWDRWWNHLLILRRMDPQERFYASAYWVAPETACLPYDGRNGLSWHDQWAKFLKERTAIEEAVDLTGLRRLLREDRWRLGLQARADWVFDAVWDPLSVISQDLVWEGYAVLRWPYHQDPLALEHSLTMALGARP